MNRFFAATVAIASIAFAGAALADDITIDNTVHTASGKSRAEVRAEFLSARQQAQALTREDSGSQYLATQKQAQRTSVAAGRGATSAE